MIPSIEEITANIEALGHLDTACWLRDGTGVIEVVRVHDQVAICRDKWFGDAPKVMRFCALPGNADNAARFVHALLEEKDA